MRLYINKITSHGTAIPTGSIQPKLIRTMNSNNSIYTRIYDNLVNGRKHLKEQWQPFSGLQRHHIIPKHQNGPDEDWNFTYLTKREHVIAHWLLWKINGNPLDLGSMKMISGHLSPQHRSILGKWCAENEIGFHDKKFDNIRKQWRRNGALKGIKNKVGIHIDDQSKRSEWASLGGKVGAKSQIENKVGIHTSDQSKRSEWASLGGKALTGMICVTNGKHRTRIKPEKLNEYISNGYQTGFTIWD